MAFKFCSHYQVQPQLHGGLLFLSIVSSTISKPKSNEMGRSFYVLWVQFSIRLFPDPIFLIAIVKFCACSQMSLPATKNPNSSQPKFNRLLIHICWLVSYFFSYLWTGFDVRPFPSSLPSNSARTDQVLIPVSSLGSGGYSIFARNGHLITSCLNVPPCRACWLGVVLIKRVGLQGETGGQKRPSWSPRWILFLFFF